MTLQENLEVLSKFSQGTSLNPVHQHTHSWRKYQHEHLREDFLEVSRARSIDRGHTHSWTLMSSTLGPAINPKIEECHFGYGSQRLTNLTAQLAADRGHRAERENPKHFDRIGEQLLSKSWKPARGHLARVKSAEARA